MFGIGLGGFVDGFARGYGLREEIKDRELAREERAEDRAIKREQLEWAREDRAYQQEERSYARSERERERGERARIDDINADARAQFEAGVADGTYEQDDFEKFWTEYALPRMQSELILQNDYQGAQALADWSETKDAKRGRQLFSSAIFKSQNGDPAGAIDDAIEAGRLGGYIGGGYEIEDKEAITDKKGNVLGYRLTVRDSRGNEAQQDVALDDIPQLVTRMANPEAAWQSQQAAAVAANERATELEDYERKRQIDQQYSPNSDKSRSDAIKALRERMKADPLDETSVNFDDLSRTVQEHLIREEIALQQGGTAATTPTQRVVVDTHTGQPVQPSPATQPTAAAPGLGEAPTPPAAQNPAVGLTRPNAVINGVEDPGLPAPPSAAEAVDMAAKEMISGGDPQQIARKLQAQGVPQSKWPDSVTRPLAQSAR